MTLTVGVGTRRLKPSKFWSERVESAGLVVAPHQLGACAVEIEDFAAIGMYATDFGVLAARRDLGIKIIDELIARAKQSPEALSYGDVAAVADHVDDPEAGKQPAQPQADGHRGDQKRVMTPRQALDNGASIRIIRPTKGTKRKDAK